LVILAVGVHDDREVVGMHDPQAECVLVQAPRPIQIGRGNKGDRPRRGQHAAMIARLHVGDRDDDWQSHVEDVAWSAPAALTAPPAAREARDPRCGSCSRRDLGRLVALQRA